MEPCKATPQLVRGDSKKGRDDSVISSATGSFHLRRQDDDEKGDPVIPQLVRDRLCTG